MVYLNKRHGRWVLPCALCALGAAVFAILSVRSSAQTTEPRVIEVTARRFAFEPAEIPASVGEPLRLVVRSADGVHGLQIKKLKVNKAIPRGGEPVTIDFTATEAGRYPILCSEYCGDGHEAMTGMLVVSARSNELPRNDETPATKP